MLKNNITEEDIKNIRTRLMQRVKIITQVTQGFLEEDINAFLMKYQTHGVGIKILETSYTTWKDFEKGPRHYSCMIRYEQTSITS